MFRSSRFDRREFLKRSSLIAMAPTVPAFLGRTAQGNEDRFNGRVLVVIQLSGGNDGINTIVPYADEGYAKHRHELRLPTDRLIEIDDAIAFHPSLKPAAELFEDGRLAIVQGVGYPNPNRSHDVSMAIWHTARFDRTAHKSFGWLGRAMDVEAKPTDAAPHAVLLGDETLPRAIHGLRSTSIAMANLHDLALNPHAPRVVESRTTDAPDDLDAFVRRSTLDAYTTADLLAQGPARKASGGAVEYPASELSGRLQSIAQLIKADFSTPIYYAIQPGYDTHAAQLPTQGRLLGELAGALKAFLNDLKAAKLDDRVAVLCFSEFGRRVEENGSLGTDHGTAGPVFVAGSRIATRVLGKAPSLLDLVDGDLKTGIDFRRIYATVLQDWLGLNSESALGGSFDRVGIFQRA